LPRSPLELQGSFLVFASFNYRKTLVDGALEVLIERLPATLRGSLRSLVTPAAERLGWVQPGDRVTLPILAGLVSRRRDYFASYTHRHRPGLDYLFAA
jgi:hypothetical protein